MAFGLGFASYDAHEGAKYTFRVQKSVPRIRLTENNLDGVGRPVRAPGSQQANAEELLAELVRLVESSRPAPDRSRPPAGIVLQSTGTDAETTRLLEMPSIRPSVEAPSSKPSKTGVVAAEPPRARQFVNSYSNDANGTDLARGRRVGARELGVLALVLVGALGLGSIFWLKRVESGLPDAPPVIAAMQRAPATQPQSNASVAASSEAGATQRDIAQPAQAKVASPENRPIDPNARVPLNNPSQPDLAPKPIGAEQPTATASVATPPAASVTTPAVAAPQPLALQSPDSKPVPPAAPPPDATQIATPTPSTVDSGVAARSTNVPLPPIRPGPKPAIEAGGATHQSTSRLDLPTKLSSKSDAHVVVAKADATGARAASERSEPPRHEASVKSEKGANTLNPAQAPTDAQAAPSGQPAAAQQHNTNPVVHAFTNMVGAVVGFIPFVPH